MARVLRELGEAAEGFEEIFTPRGTRQKMASRGLGGTKPVGLTKEEEKELREFKKVMEAERATGTRDGEPAEIEKFINGTWRGTEVADGDLESLLDDHGPPDESGRRKITLVETIGPLKLELSAGMFTEEGINTKRVFFTKPTALGASSHATYHRWLFFLQCQVLRRVSIEEEGTMLRPARAAGARPRPNGRVSDPCAGARPSLCRPVQPRARVGVAHSRPHPTSRAVSGPGELPRTGRG